MARLSYLVSATLITSSGAERLNLQNGQTAFMSRSTVETKADVCRSRRHNNGDAILPYVISVKYVSTDTQHTRTRVHFRIVWFIEILPFILKLAIRKKYLYL